MENKLVRIGQAAAMLGIAKVTLRRWEARGEILPAHKTKAGTRFYSMDELTALHNSHNCNRPKHPGLVRQLDELTAGLQQLRGLLVQGE